MLGPLSSTVTKRSRQYDLNDPCPASHTARDATDGLYKYLATTHGFLALFPTVEHEGSARRAQRPFLQWRKNLRRTDASHTDLRYRAAGGRGLTRSFPRDLRVQPCVVELPEAEFITCHELALAVAHAMVPNDPKEGQAESHNRASWTPPSSAKLTEPASDARPGPLEQVGKYQVRRPLLDENPANTWRPAGSERLLAECARRLTDLQAWAVRKELSIFTASRTKAQVVAPGAYLRRADAIRYCEESGLDVGALPGTAASAHATTKTSTLVPATAAASVSNEADSNNTRTQPGPAPTPPPSKPGTRLLRPKEAITRTGLSRSSFYERQNPKSRYFDAAFPSPVQIGQSAMGYREDELDSWIASRPEKKR